ncbi:MAG: hypothetical protein GF329_10425 [Candidatus Lokiarchaeota archaeon]|nr:hypothetical protein [Candidatus Lokiarchaeota archaeon]
MSILDELIKKVESDYSAQELDFKIKKLGIGSHFSICILDNNYTGLCHSLLTISQMKKSKNDRIYEEIIAEVLKKHKIERVKDLNPLDLIRLSRSKNTFEKVLGISCLNAISQYLIMENEYDVHFDVGKIAGIEFDPAINVGLIGAITPIIRKFEGMGINRIILKENDENKIPKKVKNLIIAEDLHFVRDLDVLLITGSALANDSIDKILEISKNCNETVLIGPTAGCIPDPLFENGLTRIAGMQILDSERTFNVIMGGRGTRVFKKFGKKYFITHKL